MALPRHWLAAGALATCFVLGVSNSIFDVWAWLPTLVFLLAFYSALAALVATERERDRGGCR